MTPKLWRYRVNGGAHGTVTLSEPEILTVYYPWWSKLMLRRGQLLQATEAACLEDWVVTFCAWSVDPPIDTS